MKGILFDPIRSYLSSKVDDVILTVLQYLEDNLWVLEIHIIMERKDPK